MTRIGAGLVASEGLGRYASEGPYEVAGDRETTVPYSVPAAARNRRALQVPPTAMHDRDPHLVLCIASDMCGQQPALLHGLAGQIWGPLQHISRAELLQLMHYSGLGTLPTPQAPSPTPSVLGNKTSPLGQAGIVLLDMHEGREVAVRAEVHTGLPAVHFTWLFACLSNDWVAPLDTFRPALFVE